MARMAQWTGVSPGGRMAGPEAVASRQALRSPCHVWTRPMIGLLSNGVKLKYSSSDNPRWNSRGPRLAPCRGITDLDLGAGGPAFMLWLVPRLAGGMKEVPKTSGEGLAGLPRIEQSAWYAHFLRSHQSVGRIGGRNQRSPLPADTISPGQPLCCLSALFGG